MARETSLEERLRKDTEKADDIRRRQIRLGDIVPETEVEEVPKSKLTPKERKSRARSARAPKKTAPKKTAPKKTAPKKTV